MAASASDDKYFLWFSDVHYDPFYATKDAFRAPYNTKAVCNSNSIPSGGNVGCDSPKALLESALKHAAVVASSPSFIIITGDSTRHGVDMLYATNGGDEGAESRVGSEVEMTANSEYHVDAMNKVGDILNEVVTIFAEAFPDAEIILSLGNNDVVPDYYLQLQEDILSDGDSLSSAEPVDYGMLGIIYNSLSSEGKEVSPANNYNISLGQRRSRSLLSAKDKVTFLKGGYYSRQLSDSLTILSINTVLYSSSHGPEPANSDDPGSQFAWMRQMLMNVLENENSQAIIVGHIPPVMGSFRHTQLWREKYINTYYGIVDEFDAVIVGQLFGHIHSDEFRVGVDESAIPSSLSTPLLLAGAITPLHGNNPSFRKVFYSSIDTSSNVNNSTLLDYESHRYPMSDGDDGEWAKLYTFSEAYSFAADEISAEGLSANVFRSIIQSMLDEKDESSSVLHTFLSLVRAGSDGDVESSHSDGDCNAECRRQWLCTLSGTTTVKQYNKCLVQNEGEGRYITGIAGAVLFAGAFFVIVAVRIKKKRSRWMREQYDSTPSIDGNVEMEDHEML